MMGHVWLCREEGYNRVSFYFPCHKQCVYFNIHLADLIAPVFIILTGVVYAWACGSSEMDIFQVWDTICQLVDP